ncbi:MAG TPA: SLBB domain-containing protein [Candidatus Krumholzibacteria bacterium]|nr:SLBB domain-containing protein [Candidatus Krumholzibacteria bacterium]
MRQFKWGSVRVAIIGRRFCIAGLATLCLAGATPAWAQKEAVYVLGADDVVKISAYGRSDLDKEIAIDPEGKLLVPDLGRKVQAAGLTEEALGKELSSQYRLLVQGVTEVLVTVTQYKSRSVNVLGEVRNTGTYGFRTIPDLWDLLMKHAGGPTASADLSHVQIIRREGEGVTVDLSTALEGKMPPTMPELRPHDTISVPSLAAEGTATTGSSFQVLGAVHTPGVYRLGSATSVVEALALAGGPLPEANLGKVQLTRRNPSGIVAYKLDLEGLLYEGKSEIDVGLQADDTVSIPPKGMGPGTIGRALVVILPLLTSLTSLILVINE